MHVSKIFFAIALAGAALAASPGKSAGSGNSCDPESVLRFVSQRADTNRRTRHRSDSTPRVVTRRIPRRGRSRSEAADGHHASGRKSAADLEVYDATASWLESELDRTAQANPGRPALRGLNRAEYGNAIRDLLDLHVDVESCSLPDDAAFGFDNIGDLLDVSPSLLERYLTARIVVSALAVGDPASPPDRRRIMRAAISLRTLTGEECRSVRSAV
jgi:hypothetical protein